MSHIVKAIGALALTTVAAQAGGFERSGSPVGFMFETGNYAELSFGYVSPSISGVAMGVAPSGDVGDTYTTVGLAFKMDLNEKISLGLQYDPSYGADITYPTTAATYPIRGTNATLSGDSISLIGRYKFNESVSVHAGVRTVSVGGNVGVFSGGVPFYEANYKTDRDVGYLIGAAYEKPEIALRVALTYYSATNHDLDTTITGFGPVGTETVQLPQSLTLDFQSGVAADTLVFASIRWAEWTATELNSIGYPVPLQPLVGYDDDVWTYSLGVGRKFSDTLSGAVSVGYEKSNGGIASNLSPTDGNISLGVAMVYAMDNMKISGGVRYVKIGDATALSGASEFTDNSAIGFGVKVSFSF